MTAILSSINKKTAENLQSVHSFYDLKQNSSILEERRENVPVSDKYKRGSP